MFCENCGTQVSENTKFCPKCGTYLKSNENEVTKNVGNKQVKKKWLILMLVILLLLGAGVLLWKTGLLMMKNDDINGNISEDITRGYNKDTTAEEVLESESKRLDIKNKIVGYVEESETSYVSTTDPDQMDEIICEGGSIFGIEVEKIRFCFNSDSTSDLDYLYCNISKSDYDEVKETIDQKLEKYKRKSGDDEFWNTDHYSVYIFENESNVGVQVTLY